MIDEGYIKFKLEWQVAPVLSSPQMASLLAMRNRLHRMGLIGVYPDIGVGYGNISVRKSGTTQFYISGTRTGAIAELTAKEITLVSTYDIAANAVTCRGPVEASSESLTHAAIYECDPRITAVIHVHHLAFWRDALDRLPTSRREVPYGTPEMAAEVARLYAETDLPQARILAMGGHEEGIITFGEDLEAAWKVLEEHYTNWQAQP